MKPIVAAGLAVLVPVAGVVAYWQSPSHSRHDRVHALQQLDLLYLDQPAPGAAELGLRPGRVAVVVVCPRACVLPEVARAQVVRTTDPALARAYALSGRRGYALVDRRLRVRYRTVDPGVSDHRREIQLLVDAL